jgi:predicted nucleic acid-binding Zn ribbon protein
MKSGKTYAVSDLLKSIFKDKKFEEGLLSAQIKREWPEIVGLKVASATGGMWVRERVLFVEVKSSIIRSELKLISGELVKSINRRMGEDAITDLIVR